MTTMQHATISFASETDEDTLAAVLVSLKGWTVRVETADNIYHGEIQRVDDFQEQFVQSLRLAGSSALDTVDVRLREITNIEIA